MAEEEIEKTEMRMRGREEGIREERDVATTKGRRKGKKRGIIPTGCVEPLSATRAQPRMGFWCDHITFSSCLSLLCSRCHASSTHPRAEPSPLFFSMLLLAFSSLSPSSCPSPPVLFCFLSLKTRRASVTAHPTLHKLTLTRFTSTTVVSLLPLLSVGYSEFHCSSGNK